MQFKDTSVQVFQDGDVIVKPGESFSTEEQSRIDQMTSQYAWQFDSSKGDSAPSEAEVKEDPSQRQSVLQSGTPMSK